MTTSNRTTPRPRPESPNKAASPSPTRPRETTTPSSAPSGSPALFPNDHARTLIELLKGFTPEGSDLIRRWVAALLLVPEHERAGVVSAVEARIATTYAEHANANADPTVYIRSAAVQHEDHIEETETAYGPAAAKPPKSKSRSRGGAA